VTKKYFSLSAVLLVLLFVSQVYGGAEGSSATATATSIRTLDFRSLPTDAFMHSRLKWSKDLFILIDDDAGAPSLYMFDRSGYTKFDAMIQIPGADRVRIDDFAAAPDGSVWTCGHADSPTGQRSFFLAHLADDTQRVQIIRTDLYRPWYLTVAPDGTVWTVGYGVTSDGRFDPNPDSLRHFDASGKLIASALPTNSVGLPRVEYGYLAFYQDRLGWYSPSHGSMGSGVYVEISPTTMAVLNSYPTAPINRRSVVEGFALTPGGHAFAIIRHPTGEGTPDLYELDRSANQWVKVDVPPDQQGNIPSLQGNDGESLVFSSPLDKSELKLKLQIIDPSQMVRH
jgi:hypothetical protein